MSTASEPRSMIPLSFSASVVGQLLGAVACFLAAFVLPANYPELRGRTATILAVVGGILLTLGLGNLLLGRWLSRWTRRIGMRSRVVLPREGIVYLGIMLVIAVGALLGHSNMLLLVFGMLAGPFVLNGWVVISMIDKVDVARHLPLNASAGEFFSVDIRITNNKRWLASRLVEVRDVIQRQRLRSEASVTFVRVGPGASRSCCYQLNIADRGRYTLGPLRVSSRFPLGIGERGRAISDSAELIVHPAIGQLQPGWARNQIEHADAPSKSFPRRGVFDDELHNIREYREGDNPRAVHWRTTARKGEIMVREYEQDRESDMTIMLDLYQRRGLDQETIELAVSLTATLCHDQVLHSQAGNFALLIAGRHEEEVRCSGGTAFRKAALDALAVCEASRKADLQRLAAAAHQSVANGSGCCVVITGRTQEFWDAVTAAGMQQSRLGFSLRGRIVVIPMQREKILQLFHPAKAPDAEQKSATPAPRAMLQEQTA
jgi:uncharacterized protein (DUF58 family)